jgi:hypothetical protein
MKSSDKIRKDKKGREKEMPKTQKTWFDDVDELTDLDYVKFEDGDEKVLKIVSNPIRKMIEFDQGDGKVKSNEGLIIEVMDGDNPKIKEWTITSKSLLKQLKATCIKEGIAADQMAGTTWRVNATGVSFDRKYFLKLLSKGKDSGQTWVDGQKASIEGQ